MSLAIGSLFSGYGGLDMAVEVTTGARTAWHSEIDEAASRVLAHRWPGVPNLGDITAVDWFSVEPIDVLCGGSPCQDVSAAGKRAGMRAGTRSGLWASMCDAIDYLRPSLVVWENVRGVTSACADSEMGQCPRCVGGSGPHRPVLRALGRVVGDFSDLGYVCRWVGLPASEVGAPHGRYRIFVAAHPRGEHGFERWSAGPGEAQGRWAFGELAGRSRASHADTARDGRDEGWTEPEGIVGGSDAAECGSTATHAGSGGFDGRSRDTLWEAEQRAAATRTGQVAWGKYEPAIRQWERLTRPVPHPTTTGARGGQQLSGVFDEWLMGLPGGWITDVPGISNNDALRLCGNGVVPQQAAEAARRLFAADSLAVAS